MSHPIRTWHGCYDDGWRGVIVDEAFKHPAKMARGLLQRIFAELQAMGLTAGDTVVDPFGGIGTTLLEATSRGISGVAVELESKFCILARRNLLLHSQWWCTCGRDGDAYVRWLRLGIPDAAEPRREQDQAWHDQMVLFQTMLEGEPDYDSSRSDESELERGPIHHPGWLRRDPSGRPEEARARACDGDSPWAATIKGGSSSSQGRGPNEQRAGEPRPDDDSDAHAASPSDWRGAADQDEGLRGLPEAIPDQRNDNTDLLAVVSEGASARILAAIQSKTCEACGLRITPFPIVVQGDSRQLRYWIDRERDPRNERFTGAFRGSYGPEATEGRLPTGDVDAVVGSPPYAEINTGAGGLNTRDPRAQGQQSGRSPDSPSQSADQRYGDSDGQMARMAAGDVDAIVGSPPFLDARADTTPSIKGSTPTAHDPEAMGQSDGNLNNLPSGSVDAVVSSPPFTQAYAGGGGINRTGITTGPNAGDRVDQRAYQGTGAERSDGNLESLTLGEVDAVVGSPPYTKDGLGHVKAHHASNDAGRRHIAKNAAKFSQSDLAGRDYGSSVGQMSELPSGEVDAVVTSPPWEKGAEGGFRGAKWRNPEAALAANRDHGASDEARRHQLERESERVYGDTPGQLGNGTGETFWSAALQVVAESYAILKPGGIAVWVVKAFVRDKKLVDFPGDWRKLCEHVGFETVLEVRASLVEQWQENTLFDGVVQKERKRASFFRRLAEKRGSPKIDWETVWFMRKPLDVAKTAHGG